jgi:polysaccharide transporter, PST family
MGVDEVVIRQLVREPDQRGRSLGNLFVLRLLLFIAMACTLGIALLATHQSGEVATLCAVAACGSFGLVMQGSALHFQATVQSKYLAIPQLIACVVNSGVRLAAAAFAWPLVVFAGAEASIGLITFSGSMLFYWRHVASPLSWTWDRRETWKLFVTAVPLAISGALSIVDARIDQVMIRHFLGPEAVGHYSIASRLTENWNLANGLLCVSLFPAVVTASQISQAAYHKQIHRLYFLLFYLMVSISAVTVSLSDPLIPLLFGSAFIPAVPVLNVLVWCTLGCAVFTAFSQWAINESRIAWIAWGLGLGVAFKIVLNTLLIQRVGLRGVALSSVICVPAALVVTLSASAAGRSHFRLLCRSILTLPSFKLGEHPDTR